MSFVRSGPRGLQEALFTLDLRTGRERRLTSASFDVAIKTGWSPDSRWILFSRDAFHPKPGVSGNVMTISRDGVHLQTVTQYRGGDVTALAGSYAPDGREVVYRSEATNDYSLVIARRDGSLPNTIFHSSTMSPRNIDWGSASCT